MGFLNADYAPSGSADLGLVEDTLQQFFADAKLRAVSVDPAYLHLGGTDFSSAAVQGASSPCRISP
ncbi:hypothetical protein ACLH0K_03470 [Arthrobacter sp. MPF02]|uniref:hypothetical protein n=1 Tax=Arthrobacter sp. MPF02 TaxID=3388492 RepID=UPI0039849153